MTNSFATALANNLILGSKLAVLATASLDGQPEAATIKYYADADYTLYFETFPDYRKFANLKNNPRASIVITQYPHTVQMDGIVTELAKEAVKESIRLLVSKYGPGKGYYTDENITIFRFEPTWIRVLVSNKWPPQYEMIRGA